MVDDGKEMVATDVSRGGGDSTRGWVGWLFSGESVALRFFSLVSLVGRWAEISPSASPSDFRTFSDGLEI